MITSRKIADRFAFLRRAKRDVAREATHPSAHSSWDTGSAWFISGEPNPAVAAECEEQLSILIERLQHEDLKRVAIWKMEGYTNEEIATMMCPAVWLPLSVNCALFVISGAKVEVTGPSERDPASFPQRLDD